jgi:hypothetical protein
MRTMWDLDPCVACAEFSISIRVLFGRLSARKEAEGSRRLRASVVSGLGIAARSPKEKEGGDQKAGRHYQERCR